MDATLPGGYPPDAAPLLEAIAADPADDTVRLAFADWLDEHGDADRAEFIRAQIALHPVKMRYSASERSPEHQALADREHALLSAHLGEWVGGYPAWAKVCAGNFTRGFLWRFDATPKQWLASGPALRRFVPVEHLFIRGPSSRHAQLWTDSSTFGLRHLHLVEVRNDALRAATDSPALDTLESLSVHGHRENGTVENPVLRAFFGSPRLARLRGLVVNIDRAGDTLAFVVAGSPHLRRLEDLNIGTGIQTEGARELFESPNLANLTFLDLSYCPIGDVAIRSLVRSKYVTRLRKLCLAECELTAESGRLLASWPGLREVTVLFLGQNRLGLDGLRALSESRFIGRLKRLNLNYNAPPEAKQTILDLSGFSHIPPGWLIA